MGGTLANCTVISNTSTAWSGGGVCLYNGGDVQGCQIRNNYGLSGAGVACITNGLVANSTIAGNVRSGIQMSGGVVTGCVIALNHGEDAYGGGVEAASASLILGCTIVSNTSSQGYGGGVELYYNMSVIDGCLIAWNSSTHPDGPGGGHGGGGVRMVSGGIVRNSVLRNNRADNGGGIFASSYANSNMIENCILENNHSHGYGGGLYGYGSGPASLTWLSNTTLRANTSSNDGGGVNYSVNLQLVACGIISNRAIDGDGGGIYISEWSPNATSAVRGCTIQDNHARFTGGGIYTSGGLVQHSVLAGNYGMSSAGAYLYKSTLRNSLVIYNRGTNSAAVTAVLTSLVENCTISDNTVYNTNGIGGLFVGSGSLARNTIVYHNIPRNISGGFGGSSGVQYFAHCCLSTNITGNGNINANPLFSNRAGNDYRLLEGSLCVDAGTNQPWMFLPYPNNVDIYGQPRVQNLIVDIGAAEGVIPEPLWLAWLLPGALLWRRARRG